MYTHYWYRREAINPTSFDQIRQDFSKMLPVLEEIGVRLGNGQGEGDPELTPELISFNGLVNCGHVSNEEISMAWPTPTASGVGQNSYRAIAESCFAGTQLKSRACNGDCSYETFFFPRVLPEKMYRQPYSSDPTLMFSCCKTAFRPYDIAVTALLIIAKHHLLGDILVRSDGEDAHWMEAKALCQQVLGYGMNFEMTKYGLQG